MRVGVDVQSVDEVTQALQRFGDAYRRRIYTDAEIALCGGFGAGSARSARRLAECFAAKEATLKALAPGPGDLTPSWREIEVLREPGLGIALVGRAAQIADGVGVQHFALSLSATGRFAMAMVIAK